MPLMMLKTTLPLWVPCLPWVSVSLAVILSAPVTQEGGKERKEKEMREIRVVIPGTVASPVPGGGVVLVTPFIGCSK